MIESKYLLDSSAWLEYFLSGEPRMVKIINKGDCILFSSAVSLHEVKKRLLLGKEESKKISESLDFMKDNSIIVDVSESILEKSADDSAKLGLSLADSVIYRTALETGAKIVTFDKDFSGRKGAVVMK